MVRAESDDVQPRSATDRDGFTLIELLIVIVILGVLATVVVFAVGGISNRGETSANSADTATIERAEEAYRALNGTYADEPTLVTAGLLREPSDLHDINVLGGGDDYELVASAAGGGPAPTTAPPAPPAPTTAPPPPTTAAPAGPVATTYSGHAGQTFGSGSKTLVIIGTGSAAASTLFANLQADPLVDTEVVWLNGGDVTSTNDVDALVGSGADYLVAAQAVRITDTANGGDTYVGAYMATILNWPGQFWWMQSQGIPTTAHLQSHL
jgi:prepilin-type N-terminal cleavage/methylation domain-containing protein